MLSILSSLALSACSLIPPQRVTDPLGLDGVQVPLGPIAAAGVAALGPQQSTSCTELADVASHCAETEGETFEDAEDSRFAGIVARFETSVGVRPEIELVRADATPWPERVSLSAGTFDLYLEDTTSGVALDPEPFTVTPDAPVTFERGDCGTTTCSYTAEETDPVTFPLVFLGAELDALIQIITEGGSNQMSGTLAYEVSADGASAESFVVAVTLSSPEGRVYF